MAVYVDDARIPYGRMIMAHMMADTHEELVAMADRIGLDRRWIQHGGTHREHFYVCILKRRTAIYHGAHAVSMRRIAELMKTKKGIP